MYRRLALIVGAIVTAQAVSCAPFITAVRSGFYVHVELAPRWKLLDQVDPEVIEFVAKPESRVAVSYATITVFQFTCEPGKRRDSGAKDPHRLLNGLSRRIRDFTKRWGVDWSKDPTLKVRSPLGAVGVFSSGARSIEVVSTNHYHLAIVTPRDFAQRGIGYGILYQEILLTDADEGSELNFFSEVVAGLHEGEPGATDNPDDAQ